MSYVCRDIRVGSRDINNVVKDFKCKPFISPYSILRGARKNVQALLE